MRKLVTAALLAAGMVPLAAQAQWIDRSERAELRRDRADIRDESRDLAYAYRYGDRRDIRDAEREYRDARREYRRDWHEARSDWRGPRYAYGYGHDHGGHDLRWIYRGDRALLVDRWGRVLSVRPRHWR